MRRVVFLFTVFLLTAISANAQSDYPKAEVFAGYSHFSADINLDNPFDNDGLPFFAQREGIHGFAVSGAANFSKSFGVVADFSYHKKEFEVFGPDIDFSTFSFLFGPRFTARGDKVEAFGHFLVGGVRRKIEDFTSDTDLALGVGGGVDVKVSRNFGVRLVQIDYLPFRDRDLFTGDKEWRHNLRVGVGVTFRIE
jgi:opacity protein-like surface antigen